MTPAGIKPVTLLFVTQHLNHCATAVPVWNYRQRNYKLVGGRVGEWEEANDKHYICNMQNQ